MLGNALVIWWGLTHSVLHILSVFCFKTPLLSRKTLFLVWHDVIKDSTSTHFNHRGFEIFNVLHYCCVGPFETSPIEIWFGLFVFHSITYWLTVDHQTISLSVWQTQHHKAGCVVASTHHLLSLLLLHYGDRASQCTLSSASKLWNHNDGDWEGFVVKLFVVGMVGMTLQFNAPLLNPKIKNVGVGSHIFDLCIVLLMPILIWGYF